MGDPIDAADIDLSTPPGRVTPEGVVVYPRGSWPTWPDPRHPWGAGRLDHVVAIGDCIAEDHGSAWADIYWAGYLVAV